MREGGETIERLLALLTDESAVAMVAEDGGALVGIAAGAAAGGTGWIGVVVADDDETLARLVDAVEAVLADRGVKRVVVVAQEGSTLARRGYTTARGSGRRGLRRRGRRPRLDPQRRAAREPERDQRVPEADSADARGSSPPARVCDQLGLAARSRVPAPRSAKPTLTQEMIDEFRVETERFKRA